MAVPEPGAEFLPAWVQGAVAFSILVITGVGQTWRYMSKRAEEAPADEKPDARYMVLEQAELADLHSIRAIAAKLDKVYELVETNKAIMDKLRDLQSAMEIQQRLSDERHRDEVARGRDRR